MRARPIGLLVLGALSIVAAGCGTVPGAVITLNPYVAAARFVMSAKDLDRNVEKTAAQIAEEVARRLGEARQAQR